MDKLFDPFDLEDTINTTANNRSKSNNHKKTKKEPQLFYSNKAQRQLNNKDSSNYFNTFNCPIYDLMIEKGNLLITHKEVKGFTKILFSKIKVVDFKTPQYLFTKGKSDKSKDSYYDQRYYLFSKYDEGICLDNESWYSVTPEEISIYIANKVNNRYVIDAFCGCGGNAIQFSHKTKTLANDIDANKLDMAYKNSKIYECDEKSLIFTNNDYLMLTKEKVHEALIPSNSLYSLDDFCVFLSPPWGGIDYKGPNYSMRSQIYPDIVSIIKHSITLSNELIMFLPRNIDINELFEILLESGLINNKANDSLVISIELLISANKIKALLVCIGDKYSKMGISYIHNYINRIFGEEIEKKQRETLIEIIKEIGLERFVIAYLNFFSFNNEKDKNLALNEVNDNKMHLCNQLVNYLLENELLDEERESIERKILCLNNNLTLISSNNESCKETISSILQDNEFISEEDFNNLLNKQI